MMNLFTVRVTYHFDEGGSKSRVYEYFAENLNEAIENAKSKIFNEFKKDGLIEVDYAFEL